MRISLSLRTSHYAHKVSESKAKSHFTKTSTPARVVLQSLWGRDAPPPGQKTSSAPNHSLSG